MCFCCLCWSFTRSSKPFINQNTGGQKYLKAKRLTCWAKGPHTPDGVSVLLSSLRCCQLTSKSVTFLVAALKSNPQYLAELHLMGNSIEDSDVEGLLELIKNQKYALEMIE